MFYIIILEFDEKEKKIYVMTMRIDFSKIACDFPKKPGGQCEEKFSKKRKQSLANRLEK